MKYYRLGLNFSPAPPELRFGDYIDEQVLLPALPAVFGNSTVIPAKGWGMLGNDTVGDCLIAGAMHAIMLWTTVAGSPVKFTVTDALDDYAASCNYVRGDPATDNGGTMMAVASYWRGTGMRDISGTRHKIGAYMHIDPGNLLHLDLAAYLFGAVGLGVELPASAEQQFVAGTPFTVIDNDPIEGGHFLPYVGKIAGNVRQVVTWGALQEVEESWLQKYLQEAVAYISLDYLDRGKSPLGFDLSELSDDLDAIGDGD